MKNPSLELKKDLHTVVNNSFRDIHCCVLSFRQLDNTQSKMSRILKSYGVTPKYKQFSIIAGYKSIKLEEDKYLQYKLIFQNIEAKDFSTQDQYEFNY